MKSLQKILQKLASLMTWVKDKVKKVLLHPLVVTVISLVIGFTFGARLHETGNLAKIRGTYKGATILVTGNCKNLKGKIRRPSLGSDYFTVIKEDSKTLRGVVRETREVLDCEKDEVTYTAMPFDLLRDFTKTPPSFTKMPVLTELEEKPPVYMDLAKKTLLISGTCSTQTGRELEPFTDEEVDVTDIRGDKRSEMKTFILYGIRRSDRQAIKCLSTAIKYDWNLKKKKKVVKQEKKSLVGEIVIVSGSCLPDKRTMSKRTVKFSSYKFTNSKVQVLEEGVDSEGNVKFTAIAMVKPYMGDSVLCDKDELPFIFEAYDSDKHILEEKTEVISQ